MFQKYIASAANAVSERLMMQSWMASRASETTANDIDGEIALTASFWRECLNFADLESVVKKHGSTAPSLNLIEIRAGRRSDAGCDDDSESDSARTEVIVALGLTAEGWGRRNQAFLTKYILVIPALQSKNGDLFPQPGSLPYFNPQYIQSNDGKHDNFITSQELISAWHESIAETEHAQDEAVGMAEWPPLWRVAEQMLCNAIERPVSSIEELTQRFSEQLFDGKPKDWIAQVFPADADAVVNRDVTDLYNAILDPNQQHNEDLATFHRLILGTPGAFARSAELSIAADANVVAHMDAYRMDPSSSNAQREIFPLDPSQRQAVRHACLLAPGDVQAINGPPGTGKTAILQSIIASYWVKAAIAGGEPPIIVGCGATNQAVTNITEAFIDAPHLDDDFVIGKRWNPFVRSYGSFYPSMTFADKHPDKIARYQGFRRSSKPANKCLFEYIDGLNPFTPKEFEAQRHFYLTCAAKLPEFANSTVDDVVKGLHALLTTVSVDITRTMRSATSRSIDEAVRLLDLGDFAILVTPLVQRLAPFAKQTFADWVAVIEGRGGEARLDAIMADSGSDRREAIRLLGEMALDCTLRPYAFHIAARYWEGRFLQSHAVRLFSATEENLQDALRRVCMLTPCIVSTVNTAPKLFRVRYPDPDAPRTFGFAMADLVIMDESGQAVPEVAAPMLALTKRALLVGDLKQIEPVSKLQRISEETILSRLQGTRAFSLLNGSTAGERENRRRIVLEKLADQGKTSSDGALLEVAAGASSYNDHLGRGLTLLFHYRCLQPIVGFCNLLSYGGALRAKTETGMDNWPPPMSWVERTDRASRSGGSWSNSGEAKEIAEWLVDAWPRLSATYPGKGLSEVVAVISAFQAQIKRLRIAINSAFQTTPMDNNSDRWPNTEEIDRMVIGTVHALQGSERPVVLFSGAVGVDDTPSAFFNSSASILNVAVSRAKASFVFFGDSRHLFGNSDSSQNTINASSPSRTLGSYLRNEPTARRLYPRTLVIVEAPNKVAAIKGLLGKDYEVIPTGGSFRELTSDFAETAVTSGLSPQWKWNEKNTFFTPDVVNGLASRLDDYDTVVIATDDDMEGEAIAWHAVEVLANASAAQAKELGVDAISRATAVRSKIGRVRLGAITKDDLEAAFATTGKLDETLAAAAVARAIADRLIRRALVERLNDGRPAGRVRAAILGLMRDWTISEIADARYRIAALARTPDGQSVAGRVLRATGEELRFEQKERAQEAIQRLPKRLNDPTLIARPLKEQSINLGPAPFLSTIEVLRRAARRGMPPETAMRALQTLYEGKIAKEKGYEPD